MKVIDSTRVIGVVVNAADNRRPVCQCAILAEAAPDREDDAGTDNRLEHVLVPKNAVKRREQSAEFSHGPPRIVL